MSEDDFYKVPGQHEYDGMVLCPFNDPASLDYIKDKLKLTKEDVLSVSFPKTDPKLWQPLELQKVTLFVGSSWVNEIIFMLMTDADQATTQATHILDKLTFLEFFITNPTKSPYSTILEKLEDTPPPRLIKTHLPLRYFQRHLDSPEEAPKFIIPMRNPKDTLVSYYHFYLSAKGYGDFCGTWDEFYEMYRHKRLHYCDMFQHVAEWWSMKDHPNILFIKYEDHIKDPVGTLQKIADFLEKQLTKEKAQTILEMTSFQHMSSDAYVYSRERFRKKFFRSGKIGAWKDFFSDEQNKYIDEQCEKFYTPLGLSFQYEPNRDD